MNISENQWNEFKSLLIGIDAKLNKLVDRWEQELLTPKEVCELLKISRDTYQRYVTAGILKQTRLSEFGKVYVKRSEIISKIQEGQI